MYQKKNDFFSFCLTFVSNDYRENIIVRETLETIISTIDDAINLDFVTYQFFEKLKILPLRIIENTDTSIAKQLCQKTKRTNQQLYGTY